ncbi:hypothetical protein FHY35_002654 [Xanthomonas arboricola]|nr:hypothetical protein [Xanthomonas arboricola]
MSKCIALFPARTIEAAPVLLRFPIPQSRLPAFYSIPNFFNL